MKNNASSIAKSLKKLIKHPIAKVASVVFALILWNYVISVTDVTRMTTLSNMSVTLNGETTLNNAGLALLYNPLEELENVSVTLNVPNRYISSVGKDNVTVTLDVSSVTEPGEYTLKLSARSSSYGRVDSIVPATVDVTVEKRWTQAVPTEVSVIGRVAVDHWVSTPRITPDTVQVSGPASLVEKTVVAHVDVDVTGRTGDIRVPVTYTLRDSSNRVLSTRQLRMNNEMVTAILQVLPERKYDLGGMDLTTGEVAEGYRIKSVTVSPSSIGIAAKQEDLEQMPEEASAMAFFDPVDVSGLSEGKTFVRSVRTPSATVNSTASEVHIEVEIERDTETVQLKLPVEYYGLSEGLEASIEPASVILSVTGPREAVANLNPSHFGIYAELTDLGPGTHTVEIQARADFYDEMELALERSTVEATIESAE